MLYEATTDQMTTVNSETAIPNQASPFEQQRNVTRTRKQLIRILIFMTILALINLLLGLTTTGASSAATREFFATLLSLVFYGFGILVTYRYYRTGLLIFAWFGAILVALATIAVMFIFLMVITGSADQNISTINSSKQYFLVVFSLIAQVVGIIIMVIIVLLAFKLAKLIKINKHFIKEQI